VRGDGIGGLLYIPLTNITEKHEGGTRRERPKLARMKAAERKGGIG